MQASNDTTLSESELMNLKLSLSEHAEAIHDIMEHLDRLSNPENCRRYKNIFNVILPTIDTLQQKLSSTHSTLKTKLVSSNYIRNDSTQSFFNAVEEQLINKFLSNPSNLEIQGDITVRCSYTEMNYALQYRSDGTLQATPIITRTIRDLVPDNIRDSDIEIVKFALCSKLKLLHRNHALPALVVLPFFTCKFELVKEDDNINCYIIQTP